MQQQQAAFLEEGSARASSLHRSGSQPHTVCCPASPSKSGELRGVPETGRGSSAGGEADGKACLKLTGSQKLASLEWAQEKGSEIQLSPGI